MSMQEGERSLKRTPEEQAALVEYLEAEKATLAELQGKYPKVVVHNLRQAIGASDMALIGGEGKVKPLTLLKHLDDKSIPAGPTNMKEFGPRFGTVVKELLYVRNKGENSYVEGVGAYDIRHFLPIASAIAQEGGQKSRIATRLVMGAPNRQVPYRVLSYMVPELDKMQRLRRQGIEPAQLQMVFTNNIGSKLNHGNYDQAHLQSLQVARVSQIFVDTFFKDVARDVVYLEDTSVEKGEPLREELDRITGIAAEVFPEEFLLALQKKKNANGNSLQYGAAHPPFHERGGSDFVIPLEGIDQPDMISPVAIINIGGQQEKFFYELRQYLLPHLGEAYEDTPTIQEITYHKVPPYNPATDKGTGITYDMPLVSVMAGVTPHPSYVAVAARYDLEYLQEMSEARGNYATFLETIRREGVAA